MNNIFLFIFCISFLCIPVFTFWALINLIRRKPAKKYFKFSGISAIALIVSTIGFGFTMDDDVTLNESVNIASEDSGVTTESLTPPPTITPTVQPTAMPELTKTITPKPTTLPTPKPTNTPTPKPTALPTPQATAKPTPLPTEIPQSISHPTEIPDVQAEETPEPQITTESAPQPATASETQPAVASSDQKSGSSLGESNFNTYDNPEQQQTTDTYVLNTSRHKIHHPSCASVAKIAPKNYATTNSSIAELEAQGYSTCGNCFK